MPEPQPNPRAVIGGNEAPDYAKSETERLAREYAELARSVDELIVEAETTIPESIEDDATKGLVTSLIKRIRDATKRIDGVHELEKMPHYRRSQGCDQYFFALWDRLAKRSRNAKDGISDILQTKLTEYDTRILREEQERRRVAAETAAREEAERRKIAEAAEKQARDDREAADRARSAAKVQEKKAEAETSAQFASAAAVEADIASGQRETAHIATLVKPADIMRQRGADGTLSTMATEPYALLADRNRLDYVKLAPFFTVAAIEQAVRGWAKNTGYTQQMDGASIGRKPKSVVR